jgi:2-polyprenyl-6-methoxyphenol hydroxylase-like FAD-dependent oxidoreductase
MKALIIGGGIGGLTTALALEKQGIQAEVFEAGPGMMPQGAGIMMASNAMQVFGSLGVASAISESGVALDRLVVSDDHLRPIQQLEQATIREQFGYSTHTIGRTELREVLFNHVEGPVHFAKKMERLENTENGVTAYFSDGTSSTGDVLVGADGIHSRVRQEVFGTQHLRYSGQTCWRGMASFQLKGKMANECWELWGKGGRFGFTPVNETTVYWFAVQKAPAGERDPETGVRDKKLAWLMTFPDPVPALVKATEDDRILRNDIIDLKPLRSWSKGRVVLLGDAAHATTPNMGQGGCQAVESAWVLAHFLKKSKTIAAAFQQYEQTRREKAFQVVQSSWRIGKLAHWSYGQRLRNWMLRRAPEELTRKRMEALFTLEV